MIAVFDNFIKDKDFLKEIQSNSSTIFGNPGVYKWYDGWFNNSPANNTAKKLIQYIWGENCPISQTFEISGFEYWTGIQEAKNIGDNFEDNLPMHFDKDEAWWEKTGEFKTPIMGSIYYPHQDQFEGGMLEIYTNGEDNPPEIVYAKPNRLIIFEAGKDPHRVTVVTKGQRLAIAINLWEEIPYSKQIGNFNIEG
jgi:hypothetical protein|tara:strand:+ start:794 stop:1378 length:585 start_codon:yes stop_codon:yes gene_type:complete